MSINRVIIGENLTFHRLLEIYYMKFSQPLLHNGDDFKKQCVFSLQVDKSKCLLAKIFISTLVTFTMVVY